MSHPGGKEKCVPPESGRGTGSEKAGSFATRPVFAYAVSSLIYLAVFAILFFAYLR